MKTLIIDNYDSFTYNLFQYLSEAGGNPIVKRNDEITIEDIEDMRLSHIVISPGPGRPDNDRDFGVCTKLIQNISKKTVPTLGVCLGHQGLALLSGGEVILASKVMHGKTSMIKHDEMGIFKGLDNPMEVMRYHSLIVSEKNFPDKEFKITARTVEDNLIMAIQHRKYPVFGVQFHPESIGTHEGRDLIKNFLAM